jgi:hypothetical protein
MKFIKKLDLKSLTIIGLVIVLLLMRMCTSTGTGNNPDDNIKINGKKYTVIKREIDTVYVPTHDTIFRPGKTIYVDVPIYVNVPPNVDTAEILKDYYAKYTYKDTLRLKDSLGYIAIRDTIFKNRILNRHFDVNVNKIKIKEVVYVEPVKRLEFYFGGVIGFDKVDIINFAGPTLMLKDKKDKVYSLGIGYNNAKTLSIQGGMYWKIKFKK